MSRRNNYTDATKNYGGRSSGQHERDEKFDKYYHGWGASHRHNRPSSSSSSSHKSTSEQLTDSRTSQKRKAYGRPHSDTTAKRPKLEETYNQKKYGFNDFPKRNIESATAQVSQKSSEMPSPYAHLPPSPPRMTKTSEKNPRLLLPPPDFKTNTEESCVQSSNKPAEGNISNSNNSNRFGILKTNSGYLAKELNETTGDNSCPQLENISNMGTTRRFEDIKSVNQYSQKIYNKEKTGSNTGNFQQPAKIVDEKHKLKNVNINDPVQVTERFENIVKNSGNNDKFIGNTGHFKPTPKHNMNPHNNANNSGNRGPSCEDINRQRSNAQQFTTNAKLLEPVRNTGNFQLFPININSQPGRMTQCQNNKVLTSNVQHLGNYQNPNITIPKRPSRFDEPPSGNIDRSEIRTQFRDKKSSRFDKIENVANFSNNTNNNFNSGTNNILGDRSQFQPYKVPNNNIPQQQKYEYPGNNSSAINTYRFSRDTGNLPQFTNNPGTGIVSQSVNNTQYGYNKSAQNNISQLGIGENSGCSNKTFNTGIIQQFGSQYEYPRKSTFNQQFGYNGYNNSNSSNGNNINSFNRNTGNFPQYPISNGNNRIGSIGNVIQVETNKGIENNTQTFGNNNGNLGIENKRPRKSRFDIMPGDTEQFLNNKNVQFGNNCSVGQTAQIDRSAVPRPEFGHTNPQGKSSQSESHILQTESNTDALNITQISNNKNVETNSEHQTSSHNVPNLQFGMKRRTGSKENTHFNNKMDQHFGNRDKAQHVTQTYSENSSNNNRGNFQQLLPKRSEFQVNPPLFHRMGDNQRFYEDINPAPPVEDTTLNNSTNFQTYRDNPGPGQSTRFGGYNNNRTGNMRQFDNNRGPGQMKQFGFNQSRQFGRGPFGRGGNIQLGTRGNHQMSRGRGKFIQQRSFNGPNCSQTPRFGRNLFVKPNRFNQKLNGNRNRNNYTAVADGNCTRIRLPLKKKKPFSTVKQTRFGKSKNQIGKVIKKAKVIAKGPKDPSKAKNKGKKSKKPKKKDGEEKAKDDHVDVNKEISDFKPIVVAHKKPAKGNLKPDPDSYWRQWWSLYAYVEKSLPQVNPNDEKVKSALGFQLTPSDAEFRKRKRILVVMGVAKISRHIHLNENDYAIRDIFNVLKYKHQLEDPQFQQHLTPKELERVEMALKNARKKTRRALFYQSVIFRWHFSTMLIKRADNGESSLKCGHARKLIGDPVFNYIVWESIQELKKLTIEDWPEFEEFYKTL